MPTIEELLRARIGDPRTALCFEDQTWSYAEYLDACAQRAAYLLESRREGPLHVGVLDTQQREAEFTGYYAAQDGKASVTFDLASNDTTGQWTIRVTELASGLTTDHHLRVDP